MQRAENAVIRDYIAQLGVEGEEAEQAAEEFRRARREAQPDEDELRRLRDRAERAESETARVRVESEAKVQLHLLGVPERNAEDVLLLAASGLERARSEGGGAEAVREAVQAVIARLPALVQDEHPAYSAGRPGNYPRQDDGQALLQHKLEQARASGDNAAAVAIITSAAEQGVTLR